ncbi:MAG: hypothetical protein M1834_009663 [Cirrosporium novae-zelandiae]|nr:MAG: hypothetical protein M1834_009663 [Cirrosporium novae-zelandiae]
MRSSASTSNQSTHVNPVSVIERWAFAPQRPTCPLAGTPQPGPERYGQPRLPPVPAVEGVPPGSPALSCLRSVRSVSPVGSNESDWSIRPTTPTLVSGCQDNTTSFEIASTLTHTDIIRMNAMSDFSVISAVPSPLCSPSQAQQLVINRESSLYSPDSLSRPQSRCRRRSSLSLLPDRVSILSNMTDQTMNEDIPYQLRLLHLLNRVGREKGNDDSISETASQFEARREENHALTLANLTMNEEANIATQGIQAKQVIKQILLTEAHIAALHQAMSKLERRQREAQFEYIREQTEHGKVRNEDRYFEICHRQKQIIRRFEDEEHIRQAEGNIEFEPGYLGYMQWEHEHGDSISDNTTLSGDRTSMIFDMPSGRYDKDGFYIDSDEENDGESCYFDRSQYFDNNTYVQGSESNYGDHNEDASDIHSPFENYSSDDDEDIPYLPRTRSLDNPDYFPNFSPETTITTITSFGIATIPEEDDEECEFF